ncbi:MAG: DUF2911 domain-containing protein [Acidobacteriota bacterium]
MSKIPVPAPFSRRPQRSVWCLLLALTLLASPSLAAEGLPTSEAQAFLGHWLLSAELGGNDVKMGLEIDEEATFTTARVVAFFGELEGEQLRKDGDKLLFDVTTDFGPFVVDLTFEDGQLIGGMEQNGQRVAKFTGVGSDAATLARFMVPDDEARLEREGKLVRLRFARPFATSDDYQRVGSLKPGEVATFLEYSVIKLTTELPLVLSGVDVPTENVAKDYPGVYGVWIQKTADGWQLALNDQGDVWGTQFDAETEYLTAALDYELSEESAERLQATFEEGDSGNRLVLHWGEHRWSAPVEVTGDATDASE